MPGQVGCSGTLGYQSLLKNSKQILRILPDEFRWIERLLVLIYIPVADRDRTAQRIDTNLIPSVIPRIRLLFGAAIRNASPLETVE